MNIKQQLLKPFALAGLLGSAGEAIFASDELKRAWPLLSHLLKRIFATLAVLGYFATHAHAACYEAIASACENGYCLDIQWNCEISGYEDDVAITIWPAKREKNTEGEYINIPTGKEQRFRFLSECQWHSDSKNGFSCHPGGHTFLAGRSYKRQKHGMAESCPDIDSGKSIMEPDYRFACTSGCTNKSIFQYLHDDRSRNCD